MWISEPSLIPYWQDAEPVAFTNEKSPVTNGDRVFFVTFQRFNLLGVPWVVGGDPGVRNGCCATAS